MLTFTLAAAAVVLVMAARTGSAGAGRTIVWTTPPAALRSTTSGAGAVPTAVPSSASPGSAAGGAGVGPLSGLFDRLGEESRQVAGGQYSILTEIGAAIRGWVQHMLDGVSREGSPPR
jgi:hypothetical protein